MLRRQRVRGGIGDAQLCREAPLQSIWEGSGNMSALDALRALARQPESADTLSPRSTRRRARPAAGRGRRRLAPS